MSAERKEVLPAPGGPETMVDADALIAVPRKLAAGTDSEFSSTSELSDCRRSA
jgi:hypothetical protein